MGMNYITIGGEKYSLEELGIKRMTINGKTYLDVTPFWIDSKASQHIQNVIAERTSRTIHTDRKGGN